MWLKGCRLLLWLLLLFLLFLLGNFLKNTSEFRKVFGDKVFKLFRVFGEKHWVIGGVRRRGLLLCRLEVCKGFGCFNTFGLC